MRNEPNPATRLARVHRDLRACRRCPDVCGRAVHGPALDTRIMIVGQAPGFYEEGLGRPFAHKAGKTLFTWLGLATGADEESLRELIYFSAVARCFPGKSPTGAGDRPPSRDEVANCRSHLRGEVEALQPRLIIAVGKHAINEVLAVAGIKNSTPLGDVVGRKFETEFHGAPCTVIPLPHPSGVSRWPHSPSGKEKIARALDLLRHEIREHV